MNGLLSLLSVISLLFIGIFEQQPKITQGADTACIPGKTVTVTDPEGYITSPNFGTGDYPPNSNCSWFIYSHNEEYVIEYDLEWVEIKESKDPAPCADQLYIVSGLGTILDHVCQPVYDASPRISNDNTLYIQFVSDDTGQASGFKMRFKFVNKELKEFVEDSCSRDKVRRLDIGKYGAKLTSPGYVGDLRPKIPHQTHCNYLITVPEKKFIRATFEYFSLNDTSECRSDYLEFRPGTRSYRQTAKDSESLSRYCGQFDGNEAKVIFLQNTQLLITLRTDQTGYSDGFAIYFDAFDSSGNEECKYNLTGTDGYITTPGFPELYEPDLKCEWNIYVPLGKVVKIDFIDYGLEFHLSCDYDRVEVIDGLTQEYLGLVCDDTSYGIRSYVTVGHHLRIQMTSDDVFENKGFKAHYYAFNSIEKACTNDGQEITLEGGFLLPPSFTADLPASCSKYRWIVSGITWHAYYILHYDAIDCSVGRLSVTMNGAEQHYCDNDFPHVNNYIGMSLNDVIVAYDIFTDDISSIGMALHFKSGIFVAENYVCDFFNPVTLEIGEETKVMQLAVKEKIFENCVINIIPDAEMSIEVSVQEIVTDADCPRSKLILYDGIDGNHTDRVEICRSSPFTLTSSSKSGIKIGIQSELPAGVQVALTAVNRDGNGFEDVCQQTSPDPVNNGESFTSPNFPDNYPAHDCSSFLVKVDEGQKAVVIFHVIRTEWIFGCIDAITIYSLDEKDNQSHLVTHCGLHNELKVKSPTNKMLITFTSDYGEEHQGFNATVLTDNLAPGPACPTKDFSFKESLVLPTLDKTGLYRANYNCWYKLKVDPGKIIKLTITKLDLEYSLACTDDALILYDGMDVKNQVIAKVCGTFDSVVKYSHGNEMLVVFTTDGQREGTGGTLNYEPQDPNKIPWSDCGQTASSPRIVGGKPATPGSYPWIVGLYSKESTVMPGCGGTIVDKRTIVTAAHCVKEFNASVIGVHMGSEEFWLHDSQATIQLFEVESLAIHEKYVSVEQGYDIAILKLSQDITYSQHISRACLPLKEPIPGTRCVTAGWGDTLENGLQSSRLLKVEMLVGNERVCKKAHPSYDDSQFCAQPSETVDSCQGDSGGPFLCHNPDIDKWELTGVVSWGSGCANGEAGFYANVHFLKSWVEGHMES